MARMVRENEAITWFEDFCDECGIRDDKRRKAWTLMRERFGREPVRESAAAISELLTKLATAFGSMKEGTDLEDVVTLITRHGDGLDPSNRSTQAAVRKFIKESDLLEHIPAQGGRYVRRLTHKRNGEAAATADADIAGK